MPHDPLHIALVTAFPPGRASLNEYGMHLVRELAARDDIFKVTVLADTLDTTAPEMDLGPKVQVQRAWRFNALSTLPRLLNSLRRIRPDGVLFNVQTASFGDRELPAALGLTAPAAARLVGVPSGILAHNIIAGIDLDQTILKGQKLRQWIVRTGGGVVSALMARANYITVTLPTYAAHLQARHPQAVVFHVPHGTFDTEERTPLPLAQRPLRIVTMGKFGTYKRLDTLFQAFDLLREDQRFAKAELVIGGTDHPNTPGYLHRHAMAREYDSGVIFLGYIAEKDVPSFFSAARLSVFDYTSTTGSSGVLHQTACYGAVPVFPRIGDFVEICDNEGLAGYNYDAGSAQGMADAMARALRGLARAQGLAQANRMVALEMPLSDVAAIHVEQFATIRRKRTARNKANDAPDRE
jgi:glycosyltransferase involved in cell wall biosynthesis